MYSACARWVQISLDEYRVASTYRALFLLFASVRSSTPKRHFVGPRGLCRPLDEKQGLKNKPPSHPVTVARSVTTNRESRRQKTGRLWSLPRPPDGTPHQTGPGEGSPSRMDPPLGPAPSRNLVAPSSFLESAWGRRRYHSPPPSPNPKKNIVKGLGPSLLPNGSEALP